MLRMPRYKNRRRAQAGTTLVELLVSVAIMGMALVLIVGTFSTGLLDSTVAKRNVAVEAVIQYELDQIGATPFSNSAPPYSDCFATEAPNAPARTPCPANSTLQADVTWAPGSTWKPGSNTQQTWKVAVFTYPDHAPVAAPISLIKVDR